MRVRSIRRTGCRTMGVRKMNPISVHLMTKLVVTGKRNLREPSKQTKVSNPSCRSWLLKNKIIRH